jgi:hypothetical protein
MSKFLGSTGNCPYPPLKLYWWIQWLWIAGEREWATGQPITPAIVYFLFMVEM